MATAYRFDVPTRGDGILRYPADASTASKVSELLQRDLEIPHQLLTLYGTGASSSQLQSGFDSNQTYQARLAKARPEVVARLRDDYAAALPDYVGKAKHYVDFLRFFQGEIEQKGWQAVLVEYLLREEEGEDGPALQLLTRLYASFLHPLIHLMFGVEWEQPALVAEALAQTAVHDDDAAIRSFFLDSEKAAASAAAAAAAEGGNSSDYGTDFARLFEQAAKDDKLRKSSSWDDTLGPHVCGRVLGKVHHEMVRLAAKVKVSPDNLAEKTAEMGHVNAYVAALGAWNPPYIPKFDFFFIHHVNSVPFFSAVNAHSWIPTSTKTRLLEWKMRLDLLQYVAGGLPSLDHEAILDTYTPQDERDRAALLAAGGDGHAQSPRDLLPRVHAIPDDGHIIKLSRALILIQERTAEFSDREWVRIRRDDQWLRIHYMLLRGVERESGHWVMSPGFKQSWRGVPKL
ncbi:hypothetical protein GMORB2_3348 [Geosmithia morbida]|uniref:HypA-like protein n=1 Tax=Geosmithia morbida TaxID=1094350 RepID=A0A9P4YRE2_9HYPO|nr:uncharacterized protein GMORB2_3348 [Geosmithia morbida]KAF4120221.1 hypothetical protein GMORB2_3348 [Geosmithia morbida]